MKARTIGKKRNKMNTIKKYRNIESKPRAVIKHMARMKRKRKSRNHGRGRVALNKRKRRRKKGRAGRRETMRDIRRAMIFPVHSSLRAQGRVRPKVG